MCSDLFSSGLILCFKYTPSSFHWYENIYFTLFCGARKRYNNSNNNQQKNKVCIFPLQYDLHVNWDAVSQSNLTRRKVENLFILFEKQRKEKTKKKLDGKINKCRRMVSFWKIIVRCSWCDRNESRIEWPLSGGVLFISFIQYARRIVLLDVTSFQPLTS